MKPWMKKFSSTLGAVAVTAAISVVNAPSAQADSMYGCNYPEVCFTTGSNVNSPIFGRFKQVTSSWQYLKKPNTQYAAINTRNDDVAYLLNSDGYVSCLKPNHTMSSALRITAIRISSSSTC